MEIVVASFRISTLDLKNISYDNPSVYLLRENSLESIYTNLITSSVAIINN